jgi:Domain of unknown function (DUF1906)
LIEGCDWSECPASWTPEQMADEMVSRGLMIAGCYAVDDKQPGGRGLTQHGFQVLTSRGIKVFWYWEGWVAPDQKTCWTIGGWNAGVAAAQNFEKNLAANGAPGGTAGYFAHDIDPAAGGLDQADDCFRGIASVIGHDRTAGYMGYSYIERAVSLNLCSFYSQPQAWTYGRGLHPAANIHQYNSYPGIEVAGVSCDGCRSITEKFGASQEYMIQPTSTTTTTTPSPYAPVSHPNWWAHGMETKTDQHENAVTWYFLGSRIFTTVDRTNLFCRPTSNNDSYKSGPTLDPGVKVRALFGGECEDGIDYLYLEREDSLQIPEGAVIRANSVTPKVEFKHRPDRTA